MTSGRHESICLVVTALIGLGYGQFPDADYCTIPCSRGQHTMCKFKHIGPNCRDVKSLMNENGRMKILSLHNSFRNALASGELKTVPASSNMRQLYWDLELEAIAERWALQCNASFNDDCRNVNRFRVEQIMSKSNIISSSVNYYEALLTKLWFPEVENLNQAIISNYRQERQVKHIAQILSANAMRIGCADVLYSTVQDSKPVRVTICNYGPMISSNEQIYRIGTPCTECPQRTECRGDFGKYPHLCTELRHFDVIEPEKNFDVVQREYDDEDIDNVVLEPDIFSKERNNYVNNRRKQVKLRKQIPGDASSDYVEGGRSLEDNIEGGRSLEDKIEGGRDLKETKENSNSDSEAEEVGMADDAPAAPADKPAADKAAADIATDISNRASDILANATLPTRLPARSGESPSRSFPVDLISYLIGHATIVLTTIRLQN